MKDTDTIFDLIRKVQTRTEPFHSQLLAWFLECDSKFREAFLEAFIPRDFLVSNGILGRTGEWEVPTVQPEHNFETRERLDVHLEFGHAIVGVEVKVVDGSATPEQLDSYWKNLTKEAPDKANFLIYLTPFSESNAPAPEDGRTVRLRSVDVFKESPLGDFGTHVNWNEVVALYPSEARSPFGELYAQHRDYIERFVCDHDQFNKTRAALELPVFFGEEAVQSFFEELKNQGILYVDDEKEIVIPLAENQHKVEGVIEALRLFIESDRLKRNTQRGNRVRVPVEILGGYVHGAFSNFYSRLFEYFASIPYVQLDGTGRIGVRVPHESYSSLSVCTLEKNRINVLKVRPGQRSRSEINP